MHRSGHWGLALLCYSPIVFGALSADITTLPLVIVGAIITSGLCMLPDIDQWLPVTNHRGITHTIWFALLIGAVLGGGAFAAVRVVGQSVLGQWIRRAMLLGTPLSVTVGWFFGVTGLLVIVSHLLSVTGSRRWGFGRMPHFRNTSTVLESRMRTAGSPTVFYTLSERWQLSHRSWSEQA